MAAALAGADLAPLRAYLAAVRRLEFALDPETGAWLEQGALRCLHAELAQPPLV